MWWCMGNVVGGYCKSACCVVVGLSKRGAGNGRIVNHCTTRNMEWGIDAISYIAMTLGVCCAVDFSSTQSENLYPIQSSTYQGSLSKLGSNLASCQCDLFFM